MKSRSSTALLLLPTLALMAACSSSPSRSYAEYDASGPVSNAAQHGTVTSIDVVPIAARSAGGGAVLGAVIGAVIGNQVGGGIGRAAATGLGAVGGAVVGQQVERRSKSDGEVFRVGVRLDNGRIGQFDYQHIDDLRVGDRVTVEDGQLHRV